MPFAAARLDELRRELGVPDDVLAINAGSWGPLCAAARRAIDETYELDAQLRADDPNRYKQALYGDALEADRSAVAALLGCRPDEVATCESTTTAMNIVLWGIDWQPGDRILAGSLENPASVVPLRAVAERRGVEVVWVDLGNGEVDAVKAFSRHLTTRTRLVLVSDVNFATGTRVDLRTLSAAAHEHGAFVLCDGVQAAGTCPIDVAALGVDAYAIARHKFLCGPDGAGALYVRRESLEHVAPTFSGVFSDAEHGMAAEAHVFPDARRFDVSTRPVPTVAGATAALRWLSDDVGWDDVHGRTREHCTRLASALGGMSGVRLLSTTPAGGIVTFAIDGATPEEVVARLQERRIYSRTILVTRPPGVRISLGFWTRASDIDRICEALEEIAAASKSRASLAVSASGDTSAPTDR